MKSMSHHVNRHFHHFRKYLKLILWAALAVQIPFTGLSSASVLVKVGIYQNEPKVYLDAQGRPAGFFPEILNVIAEKENWKLEYIPCTWNECLDKVEKGELDLMMDVAYSESRAKRFAFNREVLLENWSRVYAGKHAAIHSILDLDKKRIAIVKGSIQTAKFKADALAFNIKPSFIEVDGFVTAFALIEKGEADAALVNRLFGARQMKNFGLRETGVVLYPSRLMFIAPRAKGNQLLDRIDRRLTDLKKDRGSVYYAALKKALAPVEKPVSPGLSFTAKEQAWLSAHPEITIAINRAWPPMDYLDEYGKPQGIGVGFVRALNIRLGGRLKIVPLSWEEMYEGVKEKRIDALMDITPRPDREAFFHFTKPYVSVPHVIIAPKDAPLYQNLSDLKGKTIGVERGFFIAGLLRDKYPDIKVKLFHTTSDALDAVSSGATDAYIGNRAAAMYIIEREMITNLKSHGKISETASINAIGVRKDRPIVRDILQKVLDDLTRDEVASILRTHYASHEEKRAPAIQLSEQERAWIASHPVIRLGYDPDWPPVEYRDNKGRFIGMSADLARRLGDITGMTVIPTHPQNWQTTLEEIKAGSLDILCAVTRTPQREEFLLFSTPYLDFPMVIITDQAIPYIGDLKELQGKKIAVLNRDASHDILNIKHPQLDLLLADSTTEGLKAVIRRDAYAFIGSLAAISHVISREGMTGLKVSGETPYSYALSVGIRKNEPLLAGIIQKALDAITEEERNAMYRRWISVTYEHVIDYSLLWKILFGGILIVAAIFYWNRRLAREIGLRKKLEGELLEAKKTAESANRVKSAFLAAMSHELRTPLNSIIGFTGIILNELAGPLNLEQKKQMKMVKGSARHLLNLINDVLDISKIEAGELKVSFETFSMRDVINQVAESLRPSAEQKGLFLHVAIAPDCDMIVSDERRVRQILINMVNNAVKFTEKGTVKIICLKRDSHLEVEITDSGIGIKEEDIGKLFEPFQQLDTGVSRKYEGTGLGLSVCKRILEMLGGDIRVKSQFGKGSTFSFTLPLTRESNNDEKENPDR